MARPWFNLFHIYQPPGWSQAVIRKVTHEAYRPLFRELVKDPSLRVTLNMCASLTEQLAKQGQKDVLRNICVCAERGQIEFTGSAAYHPILALLPQKEVRRQIKLNEDINKKYFGEAYAPSGFFIPEMCYSASVAKIVAQMGYDWLILDEIAHSGVIGRTKFDVGYRHADIPVHIIFRNRVISDLFFMTELRSPRAFHKRVKEDSRSLPGLITAFDGENLGHHNPTLLQTWLRLARSSQYTLSTLTDYLATRRRWTSVRPIASSWASREDELREGIPYSLWQYPGNPLHAALWQLTRLALADTDIAHRERSRLDRTLASDQYWWASAMPWWSREILLTSAHRLVRLIERSSRKATHRDKATKLYASFEVMVEEWQKSGRADAIRERYLAAEPFTRLFGGETVN
ncbi:MAG: hypothetical protein Q8Q20_02090 [bacterium]|nr:hypothetical protein [bacterium]